MFKRNEGTFDHIVLVALGTMLLPDGLCWLGSLQGSVLGLLAAGLGVIGLITGFTDESESANDPAGLLEVCGANDGWRGASRVWGSKHADDAENVKRYIHYLRQKLEPDPDHPQLILSERGFGYF